MLGFSSTTLTTNHEAARRPKKMLTSKKLSERAGPKNKKSREVKREMKSNCQGLRFYNAQSIEMTHPAIVELPDFLFALPQSLGVFQQLEL